MRRGDVDLARLALADVRKRLDDLLADDFGLEAAA
jgi:hypothetical protein